MADGRRAACAAAALAFLATPAATQSAALVYSEDGLSIPSPLTGEPGDAGRGLEIVRDAAQASCLICHAMPIAEEPDHGNIGPPLDGIGDRLSEGELRLRLVDPKRVNPETIMPAYYNSAGLYRVDPPYRGKTIYSAQEVEDVVAYLKTLRAR